MSKVKITFIQQDGVEVLCEAEVGTTLLEVAKQNNVSLMGACDGACACGTCHVYIDENYIDKLENPSEQENSVLDVVFGIQNNSRLACQVIVNEKMDGMKVIIPE